MQSGCSDMDDHFWTSVMVLKFGQRHFIEFHFGEFDSEEKAHSQIDEITGIQIENSIVEIIVNNSPCRVLQKNIFFSILKSGIEADEPYSSKNLSTVEASFDEFKSRFRCPEIEPEVVFVGTKKIQPEINPFQTYLKTKTFTIYGNDTLH